MKKISLVFQFHFLGICLLILCISGCGNTKYLSEKEVLYTGADLKIESDEKIPDKSDLKEELENRITPKPNATVLKVFRPRLWLYNITGEPKGKGIRYWLRNNLGEPPVLFSSVSPETTAGRLQNELYNRGYFNAEVDYNVRKENRKASVEYVASINKPYKINEVYFPDGDTEIEKQIRQTRESSLLTEGERYRLEQLINERERIDNEMKDKGFFYFSPDFLLFKVDSTVNNRKVNIYLTVKPGVPSYALKAYEINNIYINEDYSVERESSPPQDTLTYDGYYYITRDSIFDPEIITRSIFLKEGQKYSRSKHNLTLKRLMGLEVFRFVNIKFNDVDTNNTGKLNAYIYLTPLRKISLRLELRAVTKSNNFAGPGLNVSLRNRNLLKGAELLVVNLNGSYETQITGQQAGLNSYELGLETDLSVPRFVTPFKITNVSSRFVPKTRVNLSYQLLNRVQFFRLNSFNLFYGYTWNEVATKIHDLNPVAINLVRVGETTPAFEAILQNNPILRRSFERQLIIGTNYSYTYNNQIDPERRNHTYFRGNIDLAGNTLMLTQSLVNKEPFTEERPYEIFGTPFSQYAKFDIDLRYYYKLREGHRLVRRMIAGIGIPYGNSTTLPYVKQFFIGGTNSVRAFRTRALGPGTYHIENNENGNLFIDQTGDIKLEGSTEYRFDISEIFKGALFTDAGNIWQLYENPGTPGGKFRLESFYQEIAVGVGAGLRLDFSFFVLRFDLSFPIRKPYYPLGERWVIDEIRFGSPAWRRENLVLNIAIGYPF